MLNLQKKHLGNTCSFSACKKQNKHIKGYGPWKILFSKTWCKTWCKSRQHVVLAQSNPLQPRSSLNPTLPAPNKSSMISQGLDILCGVYMRRYNTHIWCMTYIISKHVSRQKTCIKNLQVKMMGQQKYNLWKNMRKIWRTWKILTWRAAMAVSFFSSLSSNFRQACHSATVQPESWTWRYLWRFRC